MIATSLPTIPPTLQEIFDTVVAHLREQNARCTNGITCRYRGPNNTACAVGCLIPDTLYDDSLEARGIITLFLDERIPEFFAAYGITNSNSPEIKFLLNFQDIHDTVPVETWECEFKLLADRYNLTYHDPR